MDNNAKLWDIETGQEIVTLQGHTAEIVSLHFDTEGDKILTGSFDTTAKVKTLLYSQIWDIRNGACV